MEMCSNNIQISEPLKFRPSERSSSWSLAITFFVLALGAPVRSQEPPRPAQSVADAARNVREQKSNSMKHPKVVTNDDLPEQSLAPGASASPPESSSTNVVEAPKPPAADCDNPDAERVRTELQAAEGEKDQIRRDISNKLTVPSNSSIDMKNFKPGSSGVDIGSPALIETKPPIPERVTEITLDEKVASLKQALHIACGPPEDAATRAKLDQAEQELSVLQRQLVLDQDAYYSKTNYAADTAGKVHLDAELQQSQYLQSEIERLKVELAASRPKQIPK
jgi:hypothetical protein